MYVPESASPDVPGQLLELLRGRFDCPGLEFANPPTRVAGGNAGFIYGFELTGGPPELSGPLILRLTRGDAGPERARREVLFQRAFVDAGLPAAEILFDTTDPSYLGGPLVVMRRLPGREPISGIQAGGPDGIQVNVWKALGDLPRFYRETPAILSDTMVRMHAMDTAKLYADLRAELSESEYGVEGSIRGLECSCALPGFEGLRTSVEWLRTHRPEELACTVACHCDLHPWNLLLDPSYQVSGIVDFEGAVLAEPECDVAQTQYLLECIPAELPAWIDRVAMTGFRRISQRFRARYSQTRALDDDRLLYYGALRAIQELTGVAQERLIQAGCLEASARPAGNPWDHPKSIRRMLDYCEARTGLRPSLPSIA